MPSTSVSSVERYINFEMIMSFWILYFLHYCYYLISFRKLFLVASSMWTTVNLSFVCEKTVMLCHCKM
jgi:hypothetical protein